MSEQQKIYDLESRVMNLQDTIDELECDRDDYKSYSEEKDDEVAELRKEIDEKDDFIETKDKLINDMKEMMLSIHEFVVENNIK